jgi:hypothetical protein
MPKYGIMKAAYTSSTTNLSVLGAYMVTTATCFGEIVEVIVTGCGSVASADIQHRAALTGVTFGATGVSSTIVPIPFANGVTAAVGNYGTTYTTEPTTTSAVNAVTFGFNQRGGMRWAVPQGEGYKIHADGGTERGAVVMDISSAAGTIDADMHFWLGN